MKQIALFVVAALIAAGGSVPRYAAAESTVVEATSLLGRDLVRPPLSEEVTARHTRAIESLRVRLAAHPDEADAHVWIGRHLGYLGWYREAVEVFAAGAARFPQDARFQRHLGHRLITLRDLDGAVAALEAGVALAAGRPDPVEPDGLPNLFNQPTGTLKTNLWYHLGLARYLRGDFVPAAEAFRVAEALADNPDMHAAAAYWLYLALRRAGRDGDAAAVLAAAPLAARLIENEDYQRLLRLFASGSEAEAEALLASNAPGSVGAATTAYGIGVWHLLAGRPEAAQTRFVEIVDGEGWAAFGFIAAEAELARRAATVEASADSAACPRCLLKFANLPTLMNLEDGNYDDDRTHCRRRPRTIAHGPQALGEQTAQL